MKIAGFWKSSDQMHPYIGQPLPKIIFNQMCRSVPQYNDN